MTPDQAADLRELLAALARSPATEHHLRARALAALQELPRGVPERVMFAPVEDSPGWWLVGPAAAPRRVYGGATGIRAAFAALAGHMPLCAGFAAPGARNPGQSVREAVRATAAAWAENVARCPHLAGAMRSIRVRGDPPRLEYANRPGVVFVLSLSGFAAEPPRESIGST